MGVPQSSSILIGFSITNHPFLGTTILGAPHVVLKKTEMLVLATSIFPGLPAVPLKSFHESIRGWPQQKLMPFFMGLDEDWDANWPQTNWWSWCLFLALNKPSHFGSKSYSQTRRLFLKIERSLILLIVERMKISTNSRIPISRIQGA